MIKHQSQEYALADISETLADILTELKMINKGLQNDRITTDNNQFAAEDKKQGRRSKKVGTTSKLDEE